MKKDTNASEKSKILMRTYITSLLSLMLCVTMLLGTTYAWFTSEVTTAGNEIYVGTLKVDMTDAAGNSLKNATALFGSGSFRWEPGATQIETVKVVNQGDLAFDYSLYFSTLDTNVGALATVGKYIDVYVTTQNAAAESAEDIKNNWIRVGTLADTARNGYMLANGSWKNGDDDTLDTVKIALHMPAEVSDPDIMGLKITNLGIRLMATQKVAEPDDFGAGYDEAAPVDVLVGTYQELAAAVTAGQSMRLTANITAPDNVTLTVANGKTVVIDMNGYDITATSNGTTGNKELFLVKGSLIIKGKGDDSVITYTHAEADNMGWNAMSTIFDITANGVLQLLDVKAVHAGGTDMNFVAHLNNWGSASLYMDGAHLEAPYCAVRVFNAGPDMNNVVAKDTSIKANNMALWVHMYTENDFGGRLYSNADKPYDKAAVDARLNISISDNSNTLQGKIRYGFTNADQIITVSSKDALQNALDSASGTTYITFGDDIIGDVTVTQKSDVNVVIDGCDKKFTGVMTTFGNGRQAGEETLTIKNINFVASNGKESCIVSPDRNLNNSYSYSHNVTVENCTFTDLDGEMNCAAIRHEDGGDKNWIVKNCTVDSTMHSILQVNNVEGKLTVSDCKVSSKNGANLNSCTNVEMTGCTFGVNGYAVRFGVTSGGNLGVAKSYLIKDSTLGSVCSDGNAVIMFRDSAVDAVLTLTNTTLEGTPEISGHTDKTTINR